MDIPNLKIPFSIWDYFSFIPLFYLVIVLVQSYHKFYGLIFVVAVALMVLIELFKMVSTPWLDTFHWMKRPEGAMNCNCINRGGDVSGKAGFPSGHVAVTCFILVSIYVHVLRTQTHPILITLWGLYAMVQVYFVAWSRIRKRCHTVPQTVAGGVIGVATAIVVSLMHFAKTK